MTAPRRLTGLLAALALLVSAAGMPAEGKLACVDGLTAYVTHPRDELGGLPGADASAASTSQSGPSCTAPDLEPDAGRADANIIYCNILNEDWDAHREDGAFESGAIYARSEFRVNCESGGGSDNPPPIRVSMTESIDFCADNIPGPHAAGGNHACTQMAFRDREKIPVGPEDRTAIYEAMAEAACAGVDIWTFGLCKATYDKLHSKRFGYNWYANEDGVLSDRCFPNEYLCANKGQVILRAQATIELQKGKGFGLAPYGDYWFDQNEVNMWVDESESWCHRDGEADGFYRLKCDYALYVGIDEHRPARLEPKPDPVEEPEEYVRYCVRDPDVTERPPCP